MLYCSYIITALHRARSALYSAVILWTWLHKRYGNSGNIQINK